MSAIPAFVRDMHIVYSRPGQTLESVGERFGIPKNTVWKAFCRHRLTLKGAGHHRSYEPISLDPPVTKEWCGQCELNVAACDVERCGSQFCKVRHLARADIGCRHSGAVSAQAGA